METSASFEARSAPSSYPTGNARGAKGAGHSRRVQWANGRPEEPAGFDGRRQPSVGDTSRMNREVHVRICEGLGVKFPGPTRQNGPQTPRLHGPRRKRRKNADDPLRCRAVDHHPGRSTPKGPNGRRSMLLTSPSMEDDDTASRSILANYRRIPYGAARNFRLASRVGTTFCASAREGPGFPPGPSISNRRTNLQGSRLALHAAASNAPCKLAHLRDQIARNRSNFSCCCGSWANAYDGTYAPRRVTFT